MGAEGVETRDQVVRDDARARRKGLVSFSEKGRRWERGGKGESKRVTNLMSASSSSHHPTPSAEGDSRIEGGRNFRESPGMRERAVICWVYAW